MRIPNSKLLLSANPVEEEVDTLYQIMLTKKKAPIIEISEPKEETVFHF